MDTAQIAELLDPFIDSANGQRLTTANLEDISTYIDILQRWNARINLTAIRHEKEIVTRHFGESLFAASHLFPHITPVATATVQGPCQTSKTNEGASAPSVADVGSGAGFPGIPLKLWVPQIHLTLIESSHKKSTFLREVTRALILTDINIKTARAEAAAETLKHKFDVVTLRAVERFEAILPVAANLVAPAARLALLIGSAQMPQSHSTLPMFTWSDPSPIPQSESRVLLIGTKAS
jgi:16S rRNA (guanine527-N7)-methyltransferase